MAQTNKQKYSPNRTKFHTMGQAEQSMAIIILRLILQHNFYSIFTLLLTKYYQIVFYLWTGYKHWWFLIAPKERRILSWSWKSHTCHRASQEVRHTEFQPKNQVQAFLRDPQISLPLFSPLVQLDIYLQPCFNWTKGRKKGGEKNKNQTSIKLHRYHQYLAICTRKHNEWMLKMHDSCSRWVC